MLTQEQLTEIQDVVTKINENMNLIIGAREDCMSVIRLGESISDEECLAILNKAKSEAKAAAQELVTYLEP